PERLVFFAAPSTSKSIQRQSVRRFIVRRGRELKLLLHRLVIVENSPRPDESRFALEREANGISVSRDEPGLQVFFQLPNGGGQSLLRRVARLRGADEMLFRGQSYEVREAAHQHCWSPSIVLRATPSRPVAIPSRLVHTA